jgi:hypothetical protein
MLGVHHLQVFMFATESPARILSILWLGFNVVESNSMNDIISFKFFKWHANIIYHVASIAPLNSYRETMKSR